MTVVPSYRLTESGDRRITEAGDGRMLEQQGWYASDTAYISFSGNVFRNTSRAISGALSFIGNVLKGSLKNIPASLSFLGNLIGAGPIQQVLTATLSFSGAISKNAVKGLSGILSFSGNLLHSIVKQLTGSLSFSGRLSNLVRKILTATLSFSGAISKSISHLFTGALSFVTKFIRARLTAPFTASLSFAGIITTRKGKFFSASISFIGNILHVSHFTKLLSGALSFVGSFTAGGGQLFTQLLTGTLSFLGTPGRSLNTSGFVMSRVSAGIINKLQYAIGRLSNDSYHSSFSSYEVMISTTPSALSLPVFPLRTLFIKNLSSVHVVEIDSSNLFTSFPQTIGPGKAIYLTPLSAPVYARSLSGNPSVQIIAAGVT